MLITIHMARSPCLLLLAPSLPGCSVGQLTAIVKLREREGQRVDLGRSLKAHLSPAFFKISDLAPDCGILQSELFTSRSQNLVLAKLPNSGFGRYGQFFK